MRPGDAVAADTVGVTNKNQQDITDKEIADIEIPAEHRNRVMAFIRPHPLCGSRVVLIITKTRYSKAAVQIFNPTN